MRGKQNSILQLKYVRTYFDCVEMRWGSKSIALINADGIIEVKNYKVGSRKCITKTIIKFPQKDYECLCTKLEKCILNANTLHEYIDDSDATLYIYHEYGRIEEMPRGLGNDVTSVGSIVEDFLDRNSKNWFNYYS